VVTGSHTTTQKSFNAAGEAKLQKNNQQKRIKTAIYQLTPTDRAMHFPLLFLDSITKKL